MTHAQKEAFIAAYQECALWASTDPETEENMDGMELSADAIFQMRTDCSNFIEDNITLLEGLDPAQCGHDFWLTRNHHGAGFWDRGLGELGEKLTVAAHAYGSQDLYVNDRLELNNARGHIAAGIKLTKNWRSK